MRRFRSHATLPALLAAALALTALPRPASAAEGMWTFDDFPAEKVKEALGVELDAAWLDRVKGASLRLANGCSASFVSGQGLVLTNHHCVEGCVEALSTADRDLVRDGFLAGTPEEEVRCPAMEAQSLLSIEDVTERVRAATKGLTGEAFQKARDKEVAAIEGACAKAPDLLCEVVSLHRGALQHLYRFRRYPDVRLAFVPEIAIANFGGDPDNFEFPRWDLDMALLRVWRDGEPLSPDTWLRTDPGGTEAGEPVFVSGNPGHTERLSTPAELAYERDVALPVSLMWLSELRGRLAEFQRRGPEAHRIAAGLRGGVENGLKAREGGRRALADPAFFQSLEAAQARLKAAVNADPELERAYGGAWSAIAEALQHRRVLERPYQFLEGDRWPLGFSSDLFRHARTLVRAAEERTKPAGDRLPEYAPAALPGVERRLLSTAPIYPDLEETTLTFSLEKLREALGPDHPVVRQILGDRSPAEIAHEAVRKSRLGDPEVRRRLYEGGAEALAAFEDPMLDLARRADPPARRVRSRWEAEWASVREKEGERLARARFAVEGRDAYPDATFSPRISFGRVKGWVEPDGEQVPPYTRIGGAFERNTGRAPFALPGSWLEARESLDPKVPLNLATTNDVVGGNSGSPLLDAEGRLVGLIFDGNYHSLAGDYGFDPALNRTVAVDVRGLLEALEEVYGATRLLEEFGSGAAEQAPAGPVQ